MAGLETGVPEGIIKRIAALLTMASGEANENEAGNAAKLAQKLLLDYGLEAGEVLALKAKKDEVPQIDPTVGEQTILQTVNRTPWRETLIVAVCQANRCTPIWMTVGWNQTASKRRTTMQRELVIIGTAYNRFAVEQIYTYLARTIEELSAEALADVKRRIRIRQVSFPGGLKVKEYTTSWRVGCAERISKRLREDTIEIQTKGTENSTALAVVDIFKKQNEDVKEHIRKRHGRLKARRQTATEKGTGWHDGFNDGGDVELNPTRSLKSREED